MKKITLLVVLTALAALSLAGCGSDSGGGSTTPTAVLKISTTGTLPAGSSLSGVGVTVTFPAGVTVATDANGMVSAGAVAASGVAGTAGVATTSFTPATGSNPARLRLVVASSAAEGFGVGEFATVTCKVAAGSAPKATDFALPGNEFQPANLQLQPVTGLSPTFTAEIK